ncbi:ammonium transporter [Chytriomyces sp. MP71]|nr:ammonium transporter [Chytriomyces sp. MP71]
MTDVVAAVFNTNGTNPWMDTGDNAWQLTTATFVGMQSIPGLMVFYGGIVKKKWAVNSAFMAFYAFAAVLVFWVCWGFQMSFGEQWAPFLGKPGAVSTLTIMGQLSQSFIPASKTLSNFPMSTMIYFQAVFAAISLILIAGAFLGRMNFRAWMIFVPLWLTLSYTTVCFSIWGGGWLWQMGVLDYSGGYVIHLSAGTAAYVGAWCIGPRLKQDREDFEPNNIPLAMVGAGLLWLGWNGFNGGDPFNAGPDAGVAVLNTNICTAVSLLTWMVLDIIFFKKPSIIGACQGMITGLVAITPGAGLVAGWGAICIGVASGSIPWISMNVVGKTKLFSHIDDTLGVFHTHAVAGFLGGILTGVFATVEGCAAFALTNPGGGIAGNWHQVALQFYGALYVIAVNLVMTPLILLTIGLVVPLRMSDADLLIGDAACHGEDAYAFYHDGAKEIDMARTASNVSIAGMKGTGMIVLGGSTDALVKGAVVA